MSDIIPQDDTPRKQCTICDQWYPATFEYFYANKQGRYGLYARCIECFRAKKHKAAIPEGHKKCTKCKAAFPATMQYFFQKTATKDGLNRRCKKCILEENRPKIPRQGKKRCRGCKQLYSTTEEYFLLESTGRFSRLCLICDAISQQNLMREEVEIIPDGFKKCYPCGGVKLATEDFFYVCANGKLNSTCIDCCKDHGKSENHKQSAHKHYVTHKEDFRARERNREALERQIPGVHTAAQIREQLIRQHYCCYYARCGFSKFPRVREKGEWKYLYHVEHTFPLSRVVGMDIPANDISYLVLACGQCNDSKGTKFPWEWIEGGRLL